MLRRSPNAARSAGGKPLRLAAEHQPVAARELHASASVVRPRALNASTRAAGRCRLQPRRPRAHGARRWRTRGSRGRRDAAACRPSKSPVARPGAARSPCWRPGEITLPVLGGISGSTSTMRSSGAAAFAGCVTHGVERRARDDPHVDARQRPRASAPAPRRAPWRRWSARRRPAPRARPCSVARPAGSTQNASRRLCSRCWRVMPI